MVDKKITDLMAGGIGLLTNAWQRKEWAALLSYREMERPFIITGCSYLVSVNDWRDAPGKKRGT